MNTRFFDYADRMPGSYEVLFPGDLHEGNSSCKVNLFEKCIRYIKAGKKIFVAFGGDMVDAISPDDKRFKVDSVDPLFLRISRQRDGVAELIQPVADRTLYLLDGNHEERLNHVMVIAEEIAKNLGIMYASKDTGEIPAYGTYMAKVDFGAVRVLDWHGWGICNSTAGDQHQIELNEGLWVKRKLRRLAADCDVMLMHHIHRMRLLAPPKTLLITTDARGHLKSSYSTPARIPLKEGGWRIPEEERWYGSSGSFLGCLGEGFSPYSEKFGLSPTDMGCLKMTVKNDKLVGVEKTVFQE